VTSLQKLLGRRVEMEEVAEKVVRHFGRVFGLEMTETRDKPAKRGRQAVPLHAVRVGLALTPKTGTP
jgi:lipoate-protein ligase A